MLQASFVGAIKPEKWHPRLIRPWLIGFHDPSHSAISVLKPSICPSVLSRVQSQGLVLSYSIKTEQVSGFGKKTSTFSKMLLQFAIVLISLHMGTAQRIVAMNQEALREEFRRQVSTVIEQTTTNCSRAVSTAIEPIEQLLRSLQNDIALLRNLQTPAYPASSCSEILAAFPSSPSDYYWLRAGNGSSIRVYCDMTRTCGGITGGWMQLANIDMTNSSHTCPQGLRTLTTPLRMCGRSITSAGCSSATFDSHSISYTRACGKIIGYQDRSTDAFRPYHNDQADTIDDTYIDGVSITHGSKPRKHIWSFAAAIDETQTTNSASYRCPCITGESTRIPPWFGNDYFCDTGAKQRFQFIFYPDDPLWDGEGCGPTSTCCSFNNPPWFSKQLPSPTTDDIEMRLCVDQSNADEDITVEKVELYVQ